MCNLILYWLCISLVLYVVKVTLMSSLSCLLLFLSGHLVVCSVPSTGADCIRLVSGEFEKVKRVIYWLVHAIWWSVLS